MKARIQDFAGITVHSHICGMAGIPAATHKDAAGEGGHDDSEQFEFET
jgi:hypothetical protein